MIDVAVVGAGPMGINHARAVSAHPTLNLKSVVDIEGSRAREVGEACGAEDNYTDFRKSLPDVEAVVVATPETVHAEQAIAALDHDRHLLLEKPLASTIDDARRIAERAIDSDVVTATGFILRYEPTYAKTQRAAATGELGSIVSARAKRGIPLPNSEKSGPRSHPVFYTSIHDIDVLRWCVDSPIVRVSAAQRRGRLEAVDVPDALQALLTFENGAIATIEMVGVLPPDTPGGIIASLELTGTEGYAAIETPGDVLTIHADRYDRPDTHHWPVVDGRIYGSVRLQMDRFADAIAGRDRMAATILDGYRAQVAAAAIRDSMEAGEPREVEVDL